MTYVSDIYLPLLGGLMIGSSAIILMLCLGRISGISGILWNALSPPISAENDTTSRFDIHWRWFFLAGLPLGAWITGFLFRIKPQPIPEHPLALIIIAGLLVGIGTKVGSGCTSGHGVCGIGRFSPRSIVATFVFMSVGIVTVLLTRAIGVLF